LERGFGGRSVEGVSEGFELLPTKAIEPPNSFSASSGVKNTKDRIPGGFVLALYFGCRNVEDQSIPKSAIRFQALQLAPHLLDDSGIGSEPFLGSGNIVFKLFD
jgi:hypothetical protein